jgi:hypothetical protein
MWNSVEEFAEWYVENNHPFKPPTTDPIYVTKLSYSTVIFRKDRFQVELLHIAPNSSITTLVAPGIDQCTIFLNGQITAYKDEQVVLDSTNFYEQTTDNGTSVLFNKIFTLSNGDIDRVEYGPKGASVMVAQKWADGIEMSSMSKQKGLLI